MAFFKNEKWHMIRSNKFDEHHCRFNCSAFGCGNHHKIPGFDTLNIFIGRSFYTQGKPHPAFCNQ